MQASKRGEAPGAPGESHRPNPEAIAWYVGQAEALLDEVRSRAQSLRVRGGQLAGFAAAVVAIVGGNADRILGALGSTGSVAAGLALITGTFLLVASIAQVVLGVPFRPEAVSDLSAREIANYTTERFTHELELWKIHVRTIAGLVDSIEATTQMVDRAAATLRRAGLLFLSGLTAVAVALGIVILQGIAR